MSFSHNDVTMQECLDAYDIKGVHPAADLFPMIGDDEFSDLCRSISEHGIEQAIILTHDGFLLDGRNRLKACMITGQVPVFDTLSDDYAGDYVGYVVRLNIHRRHLTASERAAIAADALELYESEAKERQRLSPGRPEKGEAILPHVNDELEQAKQRSARACAAADALMGASRYEQSRDRAAADFGASGRYVQDAKKIKEQSPEVFEKVRTGELTIPKAKQEARKAAETKKPFITLSRWKDQGMTEVPKAEGKATMNRQSDAAEDSMGNIEWASWSWNPVTGCKHDCSYCYARDIANRFWGDTYGFEPTIHPERLLAPYNHKPRDNGNPAERNVFANSMSDLYGRWVPQEWIDAVFRAMADNPQWNFLTLTKFPKRAAELVYPENVWIGTSVDLQARVKAAEGAFERIECGVRWLSIEPMIEPLTFTRPELFDWVVIGGASRSSQTPDWTPPFSWIVKVAAQFLEANPDVKIYLKTNGRPREFPGIITAQNADDSFHYLAKG